MARRPGSVAAPTPILCAVLDLAALGDAPRERAAALFAAGVDWIQLRDRTVSDRTLHEGARALVAARDAHRARAAAAGHEAQRSRRTPEAPRAHGPPPRVLVNRRVDVARAAGADGVHLGFDAMGAADARRILGDDAWIGLSLHAAEEVVAAAADDAVSYVHLAPIWDPRSKPASRPALGEAILARAAGAGPPVLAQGGLDPERAIRALRAGAAGIAVTGALAGGPEAPDAARRLRAALDTVPASA